MGKLLFDAGSFAPVLFFFSTGLGYGLGAARNRSAVWLRDLLIKVSLLIVADQFLRVGRFREFGMDFLAFIAVSTLICGFLMTTRRPRFYAIALAAILVALRFAVGPVIDAKHTPIVQWILGVQSVSGVSYPLSPWMIYPLLGVVLAPNIRKLNEISNSWRWKAFLISCILLITSVFAVVALNKIVFRWGTVSLGFFLISLAVLAVAATGTTFTKESRIPSQALLSVSGPTSLMVVPVHYTLLACLLLLFSTVEKSVGLYILVLAALIPLSIALSIVLVQVLESILESYPGPFGAAAWIGLTFFVGLAFISSETNGVGVSTSVNQVIAMFGQLSACALFLRKRAGRRPIPIERK